MEKQITDANEMVAMINAERPSAMARVWTASDKNGNVTKVRVYVDKGYIDLRTTMQAHIETVGRNTFEAAKNAIAAYGYTRVYF